MAPLRGVAREGADVAVTTGPGDQGGTSLLPCYRRTIFGLFNANNYLYYNIGIGNAHR